MSCIIWNLCMATYLIQFMQELLLEEMCQNPEHELKGALYQVVSLGSRGGPVVSLVFMKISVCVCILLLQESFRLCVPRLSSCTLCFPLVVCDQWYLHCSLLPCVFDLCCCSSYSGCTSPGGLLCLIIVLYSDADEFVLLWGTNENKNIFHVVMKSPRWYSS